MRAAAGNVAATLAEQLACVRQIRQRAAAPLLARPTCDQEQADRPDILAISSVQLGVQPAAAASDAAWRDP